MNPNQMNCENCGKSLTLIPRNGEWGVETKSKVGKNYFPFFKCEACGWSKSSNPNPNPRFARKTSQTPAPALKAPETPKSDDFKDELRGRLTGIENLLKAMAKFQGLTEEEINNKSLPF